MPCAQYYTMWTKSKKWTGPPWLINCCLGEGFSELLLVTHFKIICCGKGSFFFCGFYILQNVCPLQYRCAPIEGPTQQFGNQCVYLTSSVSAFQTLIHDYWQCGKQHTCPETAVFTDKSCLGVGADYERFFSSVAVITRICSGCSAHVLPYD